MKNIFSFLTCLIALWVTGYFWSHATAVLLRIENAKPEDMSYIPAACEAVQTDIKIILFASLILGASTCILLCVRKKKKEIE